MPYKPKTELYQKLSNKWIEKHANRERTLWKKHGKALSWIVNNLNPRQLAVGSLGGLLLLSSPTLPPPQIVAHAQTEIAKLDKGTFLIADLANVLPKEVRALNPDEEKTVTTILTRHVGFDVKDEVDGKKLNRSYGFIGQEQHLARFPGDTMSSHLDSQEENQKFYSSGMAPGLGAWGYFANSLSNLTEKDTQREKYYIAVQTFLSPGFNERFSEYRDFFKYRKMLVVNPNNGKAIVADIADAGPAEWTGKHLGGSPEVMNYLERQDGSAKGVVLYFFIDDKEDKIPLGPITL